MISVWKKLSEDKEKVRYRKVLHRVFQLPDGRTTEYTIKDEPISVCILALTPDRQVILAKQFRAGPEKILLELPGGGADVGEEPIMAACRELFEETGYKGEMQFVSTNPVCAYSTGVRHNFVATNCVQVAEPQEGESEFTEVELMSLDEFRQHLREGQLTDVATGYAGLEYLKLL
jgi:ADP-ribose pyrophosphatase